MAESSSLFPGKYFISTVLEALETKTVMSGGLTRRYLMRAGMAGIVIGVMYGTNFAVQAGFQQVGDGSLLAIGQMLGALVFGFALVFIYYSKSELLTSNMMIVSIGAYHRATSWLKALRILGLCLLGNFLGGLLVAVLMFFSSIVEGAVGERMHEVLDHKLDFITSGAVGWGDLFVRAILCNFMINLAMLLVYNGLIHEDITKVLVMVMSVFIFAFVGFEHSVANTVFFTIMSLQGGIDLGPALLNVVVCLLGNFVGGGLLIGWYYAYVNDDTRHRGTPA